jgi:hypothetical protein
VKRFTPGGVGAVQIIRWRNLTGFRLPEQPLGLKMFKIWGSAVMAGSILCAVQSATGPPALALDRHIELTNNTRTAIVEIYAAQTGTGRWQNDLLGDEILPPANSILVDIDDGAGYCRFDLKTVFDDGSTVIRRNINLCAVGGFAVSH